MRAPEHFEVMEGYCCYRLSGQGPLAEAAGKVIEAIEFSREQGMRNLLIDTTNWTGHEQSRHFGTLYMGIGIRPSGPFNGEAGHGGAT